MDIITIGLIFLSFILLIILSWVWPPDSPWSPWWRTNARDSKIAAKLAKINSKDIVYEVGCGEATFLTTAVQNTGAKGVGIEIEPTRFLAAKINVWLRGLSGKIKIKKKNFIEEKLTPASVVFIYLVPRVLENLKPKLFKELKKGTRIISYRYEFKKDKKLRKIAEDKKNKIYVYSVV